MDSSKYSINQRYFYSSSDLLYECQNIRVFTGLDKQSNSKIYIKLIDDNSFQESDHKSQTSLSKTSLRKNSIQLYSALSASNSTREFTQKVIEIVNVSAQRTAVILSCSNTLGTLENSLRNAKSLDEPDALLVLKYAAFGIQEFHSKGLVHGCICLENLAINEGRFELTSQALSGIDYQDMSSQLTNQSLQCLFYLAPEILEKYENPLSVLHPTASSDSWALGVLFFRLLTGKFLYAGDSSNDVLSAIYSHNTQLPGWLDLIQAKEGDFPMQISKQSEQLLTQLLSKDPQDRPAISDVLSSELLQLIRIPNRNSEFNQTNGKSNTSVFKNLPSSILVSYTFFSESKLRNDFSGYASEDLYFGISQDEPVRLKIINLSNNNQTNEQYMLSLQRFRSLSLKDEHGRSLILTIKEIAKVAGKLFLIVSYSNQGNLSEYLARRKNTNQRSVWEINGVLVMHRFVNTMIKINPNIQFLCGLFDKNTYVHQGMAQIGEPLLLSGVVLRENQSVIDMIAPECKQTGGPLHGRYDLPKADVWNFGIMLYKIIYGDNPIFDLQQMPIFPKQRSMGVSESLQNIIRLCLSCSEQTRPDWNSTLKAIQKIQLDQNYNLNIFPVSLGEWMITGNKDDEEFQKLLRKKRKQQILLGNNTNQNNLKKFNIAYKDQQVDEDGNGNGKKGRYFQRGNKRRSLLQVEYDAQSQKTASDSFSNGFGNLNRPTEENRTLGKDDEEELFVAIPRDGRRSMNQSISQLYQSQEQNEDWGMTADYDPPKAATQKIQFSKDIFNKSLMSKTGFSKVSTVKIKNNVNLNVKDTQIIASNVLQEYLPPDEVKQIKNTLEIIPTQSFGGQIGKVIKIAIKLSVIVILFFALQAQIKKSPSIFLLFLVSLSEQQHSINKLIQTLFVAIFLNSFFQSSVVNSWNSIGNQGSMKVITVSVLAGVNSSVQTSQIISLSTGQFMKTNVNFSSMKMLNGCLDNLAFEDYTNEKTILDVFNSAFFFFYAFFCFLSFLSILLAKGYHIYKLDWYTIIFNARNGILSPQNKHLITAQIFANLEFAFIYYCHYQIFNLFYYISFDPCLGVSTTTAGLPFLTETSQLILGGRTGYFFAKIVSTLGFFGFLHYVFIIAFLKNPLRMSEILGYKRHLVIRLISYLVGAWILCRIGLFLVFQPTYSFDEDGFISNTLGNGEYKSIFGFIPEIIELILIASDVLVEIVFNFISLQIKNKVSPQQSNKRKREEEQQIQFKQNPLAVLENVKSNMRLTSKNTNKFITQNYTFYSQPANL